MATNAWIQFNIARMREGHFDDKKNAEATKDAKDKKKPKLTFGQWLQKEWGSYPELPYPTQTRATNDGLTNDELTILMNV